MNKRDLICGVMSVLLLAATHHAEARDNSPEPAIDSTHISMSD